MEYKELIERTQHVPVDVPDTDAIIDGMRRTCIAVDNNTNSFFLW